MKPLSYARRAAQWLMAAGIALAAMPAASAQPVAETVPELNIQGGALPHPDHGVLTTFFTKTGAQRDCDTVVYTMRFGVRGTPEQINHPALSAKLQSMKLDFVDQLPAGLKILSATATGDGTDGVGGPLPAPSVSTTTNPDDTAKIADFRLSANDLDGSGGNERAVVIRIVASIDHAAFPAPAVVANQAFIKAAVVGGPSAELPSHDPSLPDDSDILTGAPTKIRIDVTRCDPPPPPPPGDEACFKVERGDVDCVPGGGAFIYNLPVGSDMAGKWIQLRATNPGVDIAPAVQLVPPGGGVLSWTITGAGPGDVVHLVVTGIDTYGSDYDGVNICCTQTIDLVIPRDLKCPPEEKRPDLKVEKKADAAFCKPEGPCEFTITVTNIGTGPYNGPIVLNEVTGPGNAPVVSGPNAPWVCAPMASPMMCTHPATTLNPGNSVQLKLGFAPGADWNGRTLRNCAAYNYDASGKTHFGRRDNDKACASIQICRRGDRDCQPPVEKRVDLRLTKEARSAVCTPTGLCGFAIRVTNAGTSTYTGPLTVTDTYPTGASAASFFGMAPWSCAPSGPAQFTCQHPGVVLVPGASVLLTATAQLPPDYRSDIIRNCAAVSPITNESNLDNNRACAEMRVPNRNPGRPHIKVEKTGDKVCEAGKPCTFEITITNDGTAPFNGPVRIGDAIGVDGSGRLDGVPVTSIAPPFGCSPEPATLPLSCVTNLTLAPGESNVHTVTVVIPAGSLPEGQNGPVGAQNCVGVVPPDRPVTRGNTGVPALPATGDADRDAYACHDFTISQPEKPQCSEGFVLNQAGRCVCPDGSRFRNGQCVPVQTGDPVTPVPPKRCVLLEGQIRTQDGRCICPRPTTLVNGKCVAPETPKPPVRQCKLLEGQIRTQNGNCVCPRGTELKGNRCVSNEPPPVRQCKLLPGQIRTQDGRCVCPRGTSLKGSRCVSNEPPPVRQCKLLPGQIRTQDGRCICPRGTNLVDGACRKREVQVDCPRGTVLVRGQCVKRPPVEIQCRKGQVLRNGECVTLLRERPRVLEVNPEVLRRLLPRNREQQQEDPNRKN